MKEGMAVIDVHAIHFDPSLVGQRRDAPALRIIGERSGDVVNRIGLQRDAQPASRATHLARDILEADPDERHNRWDDPTTQPLKQRLLHNALSYELRREPTRMPRIAGA